MNERRHLITGHYDSCLCPRCQEAAVAVPAADLARLRYKLALARKAIAAAEEMRRKAASSKNRAAMAAIEAFDAAMAEVRKGEG